MTREGRSNSAEKKSGGGSVHGVGGLGPVQAPRLHRDAEVWQNIGQEKNAPGKRHPTVCFHQ